MTAYRPVTRFSSDYEMDLHDVIGDGEAPVMIAPSAQQGREVVPDALKYDDGEAQGYAVWHEVTVQPYTYPSSGEPALMITQYDATGRAETESVLTKLNEVSLALIYHICLSLVRSLPPSFF